MRRAGGHFVFVAVRLTGPSPAAPAVLVQQSSQRFDDAADDGIDVGLASAVAQPVDFAQHDAVGAFADDKLPYGGMPAANQSASRTYG